MASILIVDDNEVNIDSLIEILEDRYEIYAATSGLDALDLLSEEDIDLVLLDIMMPQMNGYEVCKKIKSNPLTKDIPVIFITASTDEESIEKAYSVGGSDYINKPFKVKEIISRVANQLLLSNKQKTLERIIAKKTQKIQEMNIELIKTQEEIILTLWIAAESRSKETGNHIKRVAKYSYLLAKYYGLDEELAQKIYKASPLHDLGKIAIPDNILNKPAKLTNEEYEIMKTHAQIGYDILKNSKRELLKTAAIIAYEHHEKWDGSGYPRGLKGKEISIEGRITALADVFDALGSDRCYKKAWPDEKIFELIENERAKHFDPDLVDIFFEHLDEFLKIRNELKDNYEMQ